MKLSEFAFKNKELMKLQEASPMTCYQLRPRKCVDRSFECKTNSSEFIKEITDIEGMSETLEVLRTYRLKQLQPERSNQYPKIVFLGTGSCIPNKTRNVSSILVYTR